MLRYCYDIWSNYNTRDILDFCVKELGAFYDLDVIYENGQSRSFSESSAKSGHFWSPIAQICRKDDVNALIVYQVIHYSISIGFT